MSWKSRQSPDSWALFIEFLIPPGSRLPVKLVCGTWHRKDTSRPFFMVLAEMTMFWRVTCFSLGYHRTTITVPKKLEIPQNLMLKSKGWYQPEEELVSRKAISHSSDNLSDHSAGEIGVQTLMGCWWAGPHLDQNCLVLHTSYLLFNFNTHVKRPLDRLGDYWTSLLLCPVWLYHTHLLSLLFTVTFP